jgi:CRP-like cAMP-binding protein
VSTVPFAPALHDTFAVITRRAARLSPGEIAALDWGAGYGYARSATVVATVDSRLLALSPAHFQALVRSAPLFSQRVKAAASERLTRVSR